VTASGGKTWLDGVTGFGRITTEPLEWLPLEFLCFNMRASDREEITAMLPTDNPLEWAAMLHQALAKDGCGWIARFNGRPAACMGVFANFPGNWQVFSFGTDLYPRVMVVFKDRIERMVAFARARGMHRLECRRIASHGLAHACIRLVELKPEVTMKQYGRHGEDFILFARTWPIEEKKAVE
jgi:hypothetical protein